MDGACGGTVYVHAADVQKWSFQKSFIQSTLNIDVFLVYSGIAFYLSLSLSQARCL